MPLPLACRREAQGYQCGRTAFPPLSKARLVKYERTEGQTVLTATLGSGFHCSNVSYAIYRSELERAPAIELYLRLRPMKDLNSFICSISKYQLPASHSFKAKTKSLTVHVPHLRACSMPITSTTRRTSGMPRALNALALASVALWRRFARSPELNAFVLGSRLRLCRLSL